MYHRYGVPNVINFMPRRLLNSFNTSVASNMQTKWGGNVHTLWGLATATYNLSFLAAPGITVSSTLIRRNYIIHKETHTNLHLIYLIEISLCLPFSDWFGTKRNFVWLKINRKMVNRIWFQLIWHESKVDLSVLYSSEGGYTHRSRRWEQQKTTWWWSGTELNDCDARPHIFIYRAPERQG